LIVCMMLNCTTRKQVEKVLPSFFEKWPTPQSFMDASLDDVIESSKSLGFANRRAQNMMLMTERFLASNWDDVRELPGVGKYAARSFEIFCLNKLGSEPPIDHALVKYYEWAKFQGTNK